jgi:hypothetical protein
MRVTVTSPTESQSSRRTPAQAAKRGMKGTIRMLAMPAIAVFMPIMRFDTPIRSISKDRSGIVRLNPMPTAVTQAIAAAMAATCERLKPGRAVIRD